MFSLVKTSWMGILSLFCWHENAWLQKNEKKNVVTFDFEMSSRMYMNLPWFLVENFFISICFALQASINRNENMSNRLWITCYFYNSSWVLETYHAWWIDLDFCKSTYYFPYSQMFVSFQWPLNLWYAVTNCFVSNLTLLRPLQYCVQLLCYSWLRRLIYVYTGDIVSHPLNYYYRKKTKCNFFFWRFFMRNITINLNCVLRY